MPQIPIPPEPPEKVFGLVEPFDMFYKLDWEISQFREVMSRPVDDKVGFSTPAYHAFNCGHRVAFGGLDLGKREHRRQEVHPFALQSTDRC